MHSPRKKKSEEEYRLEIAALSLDMMEQDTNEAASESPYMDTSPFVKVVNEALEDIGIYGVYDNLIRQEAFCSAINQVAKSRGLANFSARVAPPDGKQPLIEYTGIPNNRPSYPNDNLNWGLGGWWWDVHFGAITADKLVKEGSLMLGEPFQERQMNVTRNDGNMTEPLRSIYDAAAFFKEYRNIMRSPNPDLMPLHAIHGFIWQYIVLTQYDPLEYPAELLYAFCNDGISKEEEVESLHNDISRECRHGFGHGIYYLLALHDMEKDVDISRQTRMAVQIDLSETSRCIGYQLCEDAPAGLAKKDCRKGLDHSRGMFSVGGNSGRDRDLQERYKNERKDCVKKVILLHEEIKDLQ